MRALLLLLLVFSTTCAQPAVEFRNGDFELQLGSDWTRTVLIGAEHF